MKSAVCVALAVTCLVALVSATEMGETPWSATSEAKWCLAMEVNGESGDLGYDSPFWTDVNTYEGNGNRKTKAFSEPFEAIKVEFCEANQPGKCNSKVTYSNTQFQSLADLFTKVADHAENTDDVGNGRVGVAWQALVPGGGNAQRSGCDVDGFNVVQKATNTSTVVRARIGGLYSADATCKTGAQSAIGLGLSIVADGNPVKMTAGNWFSGEGLVLSQPASRALIGRIYVQIKGADQCPSGDDTRHTSAKTAVLTSVTFSEGSGSDAVTESEAKGQWGVRSYKNVGNLLAPYVTGEFIRSKRPFTAPKTPDNLFFNYTFSTAVRVSEWMIEQGEQGKAITRVQILADDRDAGIYDVAPKDITSKTSEYEVVTVRIPPHLQFFATSHIVRVLSASDDATVSVSRMWPTFRTSKVPWCLAMTVNGASNLLSYNSTYWTSDDLINDEGNVKNEVYRSSPFRALRFEFCEGPHCNVRDIAESDSSLQAWFQKGQAEFSNTTDFKTVMPLGSNVQPFCNKIGRNLQFGGVRARVGVMMTGKENDCSVPDSVIGVGIDTSGYKNPQARAISAGNWVGCVDCASKAYPIPTHPAIVNIYVNPQDGGCLPAATKSKLGFIQREIASIGTRQGPKGDKGDKGEAGADGNTGPMGPQGPAGPMGPAGPQGPMGPQGPTGPAGPAGNNGEPGPKGEKGDKGDRGDKGDKGDVGPQGDVGHPGPKGDIGPVGPKGDKGETGPQGPQGASGIIGAQGSHGPQGPDGPRGPTGATGPIGPVAQF